MNKIIHVSRTKLVAIPLAIALTLSVGAGVAMAATSPPKVSTGSVASMMPTFADVNGTVNPNGAATSWYFEYGLSTAVGYASKTAAKSAGSGTTDVSVTGTLTGLSPATSYNYRIVAVNSRGTTVGGVGIFNTSAAPAVVTGAASSITASSAKLNGIVNPEALSTSWYFQYGSTTAYGSSTLTKQVATDSGDTIVSIGIAHLAAKSTYHYRVVAKSSAGTSYGTDMMLTTGLSMTMNASVPSVIYGGFATLSGAVATGKSGVHVTVMSEAFDQTAFSGIADVTTGNGGAWSFSAQPTVRTTFKAQTSSGSSSPVMIGVSPRVYLNVVSGGRLSTRVVGAISFAGHVLQLQRLSRGLWVTWKHVRLNGSAKAVFSTSLPKGSTTIRMAIGPFVPGINQAAAGYLAGFSRTVQYRR
ncbi:MAG TPA: hypothetical protein VMU99_07235 [Acidimicrobiales bacterium]|nr:hypothetical protein [Acidimicrobiales bacterium]